MVVASFAKVFIFLFQQRIRQVGVMQLIFKQRFLALDYLADNRE
jgi:hypothetical protein